MRVQSTGMSAISAAGQSGSDANQTSEVSLDAIIKALQELIRSYLSASPSQTSSSPSSGSSSGARSGGVSSSSGASNNQAPAYSGQNMATQNPASANPSNPRQPSGSTQQADATGQSGQPSANGSSPTSPNASSQASSSEPIGGNGRPPGSSTSIKGTKPGDPASNHYKIVNGAEQFSIDTKDRMPGFWNMPRSEGAFLNNKFSSGRPASFSADYAIQPGTQPGTKGFVIAQQFHDSGHPQMMVTYKDGYIKAGDSRVAMPIGQKFNLQIKTGPNGTQVFVDGKLLHQEPLRHSSGENYFRYGAYLQGRDAGFPPATAIVQVSNAKVST